MGNELQGEWGKGGRRTQNACCVWFSDGGGVIFVSILGRSKKKDELFLEGEVSDYALERTRRTRVKIPWSVRVRKVF